MRFIEKYPQSTKPLILTLIEDKEECPEDNYYAMNFSLLTQNSEEVAAGRCCVMRYDSDIDSMYITAIYVEGNNNYPTKKEPNRSSGLGKLLVFAAIKFGFELKVETATLTPLDGSEGFYIKMGFYPKVIGVPNKMVTEGIVQRPGNGKLNPDWVRNFEQSSFLHRDYRGAVWVGRIPTLYPRLRGNICSTWTIAE